MYNNFYNPAQNRMDTIDNQIASLQQQRVLLQQQMQSPPINQNFYQAPVQQPQSTQNYDFNGKWVEGIDEVKKVSSDNLPLLIFDKNGMNFYIKQLDGKLNAFKYEPIEIEEKKDNQEVNDLKKELDEMKNQFNALIQALNKPADEPQTKKAGKNDAKSTV